MSLLTRPQAFSIYRSKILPVALTTFVVALSFTSGVEAQIIPTPPTMGRPTQTPTSTPLPTTPVPFLATPSHAPENVMITPPLLTPATQIKPPLQNTGAPTPATTATPRPTPTALQIKLPGIGGGDVTINIPPLPTELDIQELMKRFHEWQNNPENRSRFCAFQDQFDKLFKEYNREILRLILFVRDQQQHCSVVLSDMHGECRLVGDLEDHEKCLNDIASVKAVCDQLDPFNLIPGLTPEDKEALREAFLDMIEDRDLPWTSCPIPFPNDYKRDY